MEKLQKFCLNLSLVLLFFSCNKDNKEASLKSMQFSRFHYQGTKTNLNALARAIELDSTNENAWREFSIPFLKRGLPHKWKPAMDKSVGLNPTKMIGYRGYNYLWFYRDYKRAIADFDRTDILTPNFIEAPQGLSVDCWRGIAYLGLKDYKNSILYFDKYINKEIEDFSEKSVDITAFLYKGIAYYESNNLEKSEVSFKRLIKNNYGFSADGKYYLALIYKQQEKNKAALKMIDDAMKDFNNGYFNKRPYVETLRQIYLEDLQELKKSL